MRPHESADFQNIAASTAAFNLEGGVFAVSVSATFGGGTVKLQQLSGDGVTWIDPKQTFDDGSSTAVDLAINSFSANGQKILILPAGQFRFTIATATAVYANIARCPGD